MSCVTQRAANVVIEPVDLYWGNQHLVCIEPVANVSDSLDGKYFLFSTKDLEGYVWYTSDIGVDPAIAGKTGVQVTLDSDETAQSVAAKTVLALNAVDSTLKLHAKDKSTASKAAFLMESKLQGEIVSDYADGPTGYLLDDATGFTIEVVREGFELALGLTEGGLSLGTEVTTFDVVSDQTGPDPINKIITALGVGPISVTLKETQAEKLKRFIEVSGSTVTPTLGSTPTAVSGWGSLSGSKQYTSALAEAAKLVLHPVALARTEVSRDFAFWLAYPRITDLSFSGEEDRKLQVEFDIFIDEARINAVNKFVYGNHEQNLLV